MDIVRAAERDKIAWWESDPGCDYVVGDVNASCNYNGLDITYGVNYFKYGSPGPQPCADCPPIE
jgi:hypothetical protein